MYRVGLLLAAGAVLVGCGSTSQTGMRISCTNGISVEPLAHFEVRQVPAIGPNPPSASISYPDPLHRDQTGSLTLAPGERCTATISTKT